MESLTLSHVVALLAFILNSGIIGYLFTHWKKSILQEKDIEILKEDNTKLEVRIKLLEDQDNEKDKVLSAINTKLGIIVKDLHKLTEKFENLETNN